MNYVRFGAMVAASTIVMFGLMYLNTYTAAHVRYSETRLYMALIMGAAMAVIMMVSMGKMYQNRRLNGAILMISALVFSGSLWAVRSQRTIGDVAYMKAMIPHHSIAILTSERAQIRDPRVRQLADGIIRTQAREIGQMNDLIADLQHNPTPASQPKLPPGAGQLPG
jgi:uncharacterized protein (DUF305 family)